MREKEIEGNYSSILGVTSHRFIRLSRVLLSENSFIRSLDLSGLQFPTLDS